MRKIVALLILSGIGCLLLAGCSRKKTDPRQIVAEVGGDKVELGEVLASIPSRTFTSAEAEYDHKKFVLENIITQQLLVQAGRQAGIDTLSAIRTSLEVQKEPLLVDCLYVLEISDRVKVTERDIKDLYQKMCEERRVLSIEVQEKHTADSLYRLLQDGADFRQLASQFTIDTFSKRKGGDLGFVRFDGSDPVFQGAVFATETGGFSKPIKSERGWRILKVVEVRPVKQPEYSLVRDQLAQQLTRAKGDELAAAFLARVREEVPITVDDSILEFTRAKQRQLEQVRDRRGLQLRTVLDLSKLTDREKGKILAFCSRDTFTVGQYFELVRDMMPVRRPRLRNKEEVIGLAFQLMFTKIMAGEAKKRGIDRSDYYKKVLQDFVGGMVANEMQKEILKSAVVTDSAVKAYYAEHRSEYEEPLALHLREIQVATAGEAEAIYQKIKSPTDFFEMAHEKTIRPGYRPQAGDLGFVVKYQFPEIFSVAETLQQNRYSAPIRNADNTYSLVQLLGRQPGKSKPFDSVKVEISNKLANDLRQRTINDWLDLQKKKVKVVVNEAVLKSSINYQWYAKYKETQAAGRKKG